MKKQLLMFVLVLFLSGNVNAAPVYWSTNDHWYDVVWYESIWTDANVHAQTKTWMGMQGHLVTLTSAGENTFVWSTFQESSVFLGGYQIDETDEPLGNWAWVTGETWGYTNWHGSEPNDGVGYPTPTEEYLEFKGITTTGEWNDVGLIAASGPQLRAGYIVEFASYPVPEPATLLLFGTGLIGLVGIGRKRFLEK